MEPDDDEITIPAAETEHVEQLMQQQTGAPVVLRAVSECAVVTDRGIRLHLLAIDEHGALWERWSDHQPGAWFEIARPTR